MRVGNVGDWNNDLETAYVNLPTDEKDKDLVHFQMASSLVAKLSEEMLKNRQQATSLNA